MVSINEIAVRKELDELVVSAQIQMPDFSGEAWFRFPPIVETDLQAAADAFYIIGLVLAMGTDGILTIDQPVSRRLIYQTRAIQDIIVGWYPQRVHRIDEISVAPREFDKPLIQDKTISCFTGGVDSFDTLINNTDEIDALLYMHGFDIALGRTAIREATSEHLKQVAADTGKQLIEGSTNIRAFLNRAATWSVITHGPALASVGHLLSGGFGRLLIPASHTYADKYAWGSHPLLDHLWSSNRLSVVHDGAGSTRVVKTRNLAHNNVAQGHLRVCWQNTGKYNCGKCDKCLRTMIALQLSGVLSQFSTFESEVPLEAVKELTIKNQSGRSFVVENLEYAYEVGADNIAEILQSLIIQFDIAQSSRTKVRGPRPTIASKSAPIPVRLESLEKRIKWLEREQTQLLERVSVAESLSKKIGNIWPVRTWMRLRRRTRAN